MGKVKKTKKSKGLISKAVSMASPRAGKALEFVKGLGGGRARGGGVRRRSKGLNLNKYVKKLMKAKMDGKIMKEKLKVVNYIK